MIGRKIVYPQLSDRSIAWNSIPARPNRSVTNVKNNRRFTDDFTNVRESKSRTQKKKRSLWTLLPCCTSLSSCLQFFIACLLTACFILTVGVPIYFISLRTTSSTTTETTSTLTINSTSGVMTNATTTVAIITNASTISTNMVTNSTSSSATNTSLSASTITSATSISTSTTTTNICIGSYAYVTQLIYLDVNATFPWTQYTFNYTAPNVVTATLMFSFRNDPNYWYLDDVSVTNSFGTQLLLNGGFEQGILANWTYCNPNNTVYSGYVINSSSHNSLYCYQDGSSGAFDYLSQTFNVQPNKIYSVSFWLNSGGSAFTYAEITISS